MLTPAGVSNINALSSSSPADLDAGEVCGSSGPETTSSPGTGTTSVTVTATAPLSNSASPYESPPWCDPSRPDPFDGDGAAESIPAAMLPYLAFAPETMRQSGANQPQAQESSRAWLATTGLAAPAGTPVSEWTPSQKYAAVFAEAIGQLPGEVAAKLQALLSKESLATIEVTTAAWLASHLTGIGEGVDAALVAFGAVMLGSDAIQVSKDLYDFVLLTTQAKSPEDIEKAAKHLASAVAVVGVDVASVVLTHKAAGAAKSGIGRPPPAPPTGALAAEGVLIGAVGGTGSNVTGISVAVPGSGAVGSDVFIKGNKGVDAPAGGAHSSLPELDEESSASMKRVAQKLDKEVVAAKRKALPRIEAARQELLEKLDALLRAERQPPLSQRSRANLEAVLNALREHLTPKDLTGALRDSVDLPVRESGSGREFQHATEVSEALVTFETARKTLVVEFQRSATRGTVEAGLSALTDELARLEEQMDSFVSVNP